MDVNVTYITNKMGKCINLDDEFLKYFHENEGFHLRSERFYEDCCNSDPAVLVKWIKAAYMEGARCISKDTIDTLYDYGTAVAGINSVTYTPSESFDNSAVNLESYFNKVLNNTTKINEQILEEMENSNDRV